MTDIFKAYYHSPIGLIELSANHKQIIGLYFVEKEDASTDIPEILTKALRQLDEYFSGKRINFELDLLPKGTEFQKKVWDQLLKIPFGTTKSYLDVANALGDRNALRAVGNANGKNKISIIIPCHRVIGANGSLTGFGGGIWRKKWLLEHEQKYIQGALF